MQGSALKYRLLPGSKLRRRDYWKGAAQNELKGLIKRFSTNEQLRRKRGAPIYTWRKLRLAAVAVYEARFERVPEIFRARRLPPMKSDYVHQGRYVWPERGEPGRLVGSPVPSELVPPNKSLERTRIDKVQNANGHRNGHR